MAKRGRILYLILALLIVLNQSANIVLALSGSSENFRWLNSVLLPAFTIWAVWNLWQTGEKWMRWGLATWTLVKGLASLYFLGYIMYRMAEITPPESADFFFQISGTLFTIPAIDACIFVVIGLALFFSPSIRIFLETRTQSPAQTLPFSSQ